MTNLSAGMLALQEKVTVPGDCSRSEPLAGEWQRKIS